MVENVHRKVLFVALALLVSLGLLLIPDKPFVMGLDLQGGTRLVYSFDLEKIKGTNPALGTQSSDDLSHIVTIMRNRVDPTGVRDATVRQSGTSEVIIELPGTPDIAAVQAVSTLAEPLGSLAKVSLALDAENAAAADFPEAGGTVEIGSEKIHYEKREGMLLLGLERGYRLTEAADHAQGAGVTLVSDDAIKALIENLGDLAINIQALPSDFTGSDTDFAQEESKLRTWIEANPARSLADFNAVPAAEGGPASGRIQWVVRKPQSDAERLLSEFDRRVPLLVQEDPTLRFVGSDLERVFPSQDQSGYPAVGLEFKGPRRGAFGKLTGANVERLMVITLNNQAESIATINERLPGQCIISGRFTPKEVRDLITVIQSGSLPIKPVLINEEVVGPTLGQDYVNRAFYSGALAILAVIAFMILYYRRLGVIAGIALFANMLMLLGGLAFLRATVTLPGIAGIILTVGMAVDANILIFDRIREELDKGQNLKQAARLGFEKAFSAIFDANITTLITALILYKVGTGPVRGFAVTLTIGLITSMIAALVITRLLIHWTLVRGTKEFPMGRWMVTANYRFLSKTKFMVTCSLIIMVASLVGFALRPEHDKFGIDFVGGGEVQINTDVAQTADTVRGLVGAIPGAIGPSAEVKPILASATGEGYTSFRISFKVDPEQSEAGAEQGLRTEIRKHLSSILQKGPIEVAPATPADAGASWDVKLYFVDEHPAEEVNTLLVQAGLSAATLAATPDRPEVLAGTLQGTSMEAGAVQDLLASALMGKSDSNGTAFTLSQPIPSSTLVRPQVVGELRNKAFLALVVSLFATMIYLRVRFAEYSYGIAAVVAVIHDVIFALGALTLADMLGIVNGELSLPMVAAFLTIIGYSLNDTIVIFDRVRENLPRMKKPLAEVLEVSLNETLSRTILTTVTVFMAVTILYIFFFGTGNTLEGFCFAMLAGMASGTYSTIYIANPILLWLENRAAQKGGGARAHLAAHDAAVKRSGEDEEAAAAVVG
jgi:SecD/SecF fusion protein